MSFLFSNASEAKSLVSIPKEIAPIIIKHAAFVRWHEIYTQAVIDKKLSLAEYISQLPFMVRGLNNKGSRMASHTRSSKTTLVPRSKDGTCFSLQSEHPPATAIPSAVNDKPYNIVQTIDANTLVTTSTSVNTYGATNFTVNAIDQITQLAGVFDQYKINEVEVWLENLNQETTNSHYITCLDFDDSNALTVYQSANDYQNAVDSGVQIGHYRRFVPHIAVAAYSGTFVSFENQVAPWIDCSSLTVQHYGLKVAVQPTQVASSITMRYRLSVSFRNVR
jgi:hypothetical protein